MEMLLAPLHDPCHADPAAIRLPSLFTYANTGATSPMRMSDVLNADHQIRPASPTNVRLPSIGTIMRRESTASPCVSPKNDMAVQSLSPVHKQSCMDLYKQLQAPTPAADGALKNLLAGAALSQLAQMCPQDRLSISSADSCDGDKHKRSNSAKLCGMQDCKKRAKAGGYCIAHGGGLRCSEEGCQKHAVSLGLCISHGGGKRCTVEGCLNASRKNGVCWSHGGKRLCKLEGCNKGPKSGGYCWSHGGKMKK